MPWRGSREPGEYPTLGYEIGEWIEGHCVVPDGALQGEPYRLTDEMWRFLIRYYRLHPEAEANEFRPSEPFYYRGGQLVRPQKWGKGPFAAALCLAEAFGPVRFGGWNAAGEPVGRRQPTPWVQIVATSEEQTDNTWLAVHEMAMRGAVSSEPGIDIGLQDINLPDGGKIEPRTASGRARLGARLTFAVFDESGLMVESNGGVLLATTMKRNLGGMGGRWLETTNAWDPSELSVAQRTHESRAKDVLLDYRPPRRTPDLGNREETIAELDYVYGDSWWVSRERIYADATDTAVCPTSGDAYRFFLNLPVVGVSDVVDATRWDSLARERDLKAGDMIALGFDGSRANDCTSILASRITDGRWFHLKTWDPADIPGHEIPRAEVDAVVADAFSAYDVRYLYADPYHWETELQTWAARWRDRVVSFPTNVERRMDAAISRFLTAVAGDLTHDGDPILSQHLRAAALSKGGRKKPRPEEDQSVVHHYLKIVKKRQTGHIDALIAGILAEEARGKAIEDGALSARQKPWAFSR